jgi:hypothetical protein
LCPIAPQCGRAERAGGEVIGPQLTACTLRVRTRGSLDWGDEAISATGYIRDEPIPVLTIAERFAKDGDVEFEIALLHELLGPHTSEKLFLADHDAGTLKQSSENFARSTPEPNGRLSVQQKLLVAKQPK